MNTLFSLSNLADQTVDFAKKYGIRFGEAVAILVLGWLLIKLVKRILKKAFEKTELDVSLEKFIISVVDICLKILLVICALSALGISTTGLVAAFSAAAVAVSLALKDSLGNLAGGILMLLTRPFKTGDYIEADGYSGTVLQIDMIHTTLRTPDNRQVVIPNGQLVNKTIVDYSKESTRRMDLQFGISYDNDPELAKKIILDCALAHEFTLTDPEPFVRVTEHADSAVIITMRVWVKSENFWALHFDLLEKVREEFDKNGISIPYNQLDVHVIKNG
ncbi:MAG: mechanosensitive ion channel [Clostridia bacterium]|nr:mechanosensitive ion channel [Clostridia bacterium]